MPVSSLFPPLDLPEVDVFSFIFRRTSTPFPDDQVIHQDGDNLARKLSFKDIRTAAIEFGNGLQSHFNIQKGDVVGLFTPNDIETPVVTLAALYTGAIVSPSNPAYTVSELAYQLKDSGAKLLITHSTALDTARKACEQVGISESQILLVDNPQSKTTFPHWSTFSQTSSNAKPVSINPKTDLAFLVYSSGTTGRPKGVMISHYNIVSNVVQITACEAGKLSWDGSRTTPKIPNASSAGDKILACLPFFHIYGLTSLILAPLYNGITTTVMPKFEILHFCDLIQSQRITFIYIVPPQALLLAKHPSIPNYDLSSIRMTNSGAAPLTKELQAAVYARTGVRIKQGYGLSETSPTTHEQRWEDWDIKVGTIGRLQPNMSAKFCSIGAEADDVGTIEELPIGETGELYLKGPNVFKGYWKNTSATAECLSRDGWFRTGDVGHVDADGDFFITDRVKELIKYKGFQVPPAELEGYLVDHELVDDALVVGVYSKKMGTEVPRACIVRKGGLGAVRDGDAEAIVNWLAERVVGHKRLRGGVKFVDVIPKTPSGKLLRRAVRDEMRKEFAEIEEGRVKAKL